MISRAKPMISRDSCDCVFFASSFSFFSTPNNNHIIARTSRKITQSFFFYFLLITLRGIPPAQILCFFAHGLMDSWPRGLLLSWPRSCAHGLMGSWAVVPLWTWGRAKTMLPTTLQTRRPTTHANDACQRRCKMGHGGFARALQNCNLAFLQTCIREK